MMQGGTTAKMRRVKPSYELWKPHMYQEKATDFLCERGSAALFLDPGLGKTSITLNAFCRLQDAGRVKQPMLVVAPLRVCQLVWEQEGQRWEQFRHLTFTLLHGPRKKAKLQEKSDVFLINPEGVPWLVDQFWGKRLPFSVVTIDELTRFKNSQALRHKKLHPKLAKVQYRWGLTGTPIPNGYMDLFGQMKLLDDGASLGRWFSHFRNKYFDKDFSGFTYTLRRGATKAIEEAIRPYVLRMSAEDYLEMPRLIPDIRPVVMPPAARKTYEKMKRDMVVDLEGQKIEGSNAAAVYSKLKQMGNGAVYHGDGFMEPKKTIHIHDAKIEAMQELVDELAGTPLLIGYEFNHDLVRLRKALGDPPYLGKGVSGKKAQEIENAWNKGELPILLAHPASAGHGLNLQKGNACHLAWFSMTWDYELYDQFIRRIMRQGNKSMRIFNHVFIVENSIDIKSRDVIKQKGLKQHAFFDALNTEIYQDGKVGTSPDEAILENEDTTMVRKLSRRSKRKVEDQVEDDQLEGEEEEEQEEQPKRVSRRGASSGTKRKLRGKAVEEEEEEEEEQEEGEEEPVSKRARSNFSKAVQKRLSKDEEAGEEESEEGEEEEEQPEEKPVSKRRGVRKSSKSTTTRKAVVEDEPEEEGGGGIELDYDLLAEALIRQFAEKLLR